MNDIPSEKHSPWHTGELQVQMHAGVVERMDVVGRKFVRDFMPDQHREFYEQIPYLIVGAVDAEGWPWASMMDAHEGFISALNARQLDIDWLPDATDPVSEAFRPGAALGLLGIDLHTRRRNRLNGHIDTVGEAGFSLAVEQSYGNCPQYIQLRPLERANEAAVTERPPVQHLDALDDAAIATIRGADTFFVASYVDQKGDGPGEQSHRSVDVSHRGGRAGFVRVEGDVLTIPDFAGNLFFNTLGNLLVNPRAGLVFIDFASGDMLHVAGLATVILDSPEIAAFQGAERLWQVKVEKVLRRPAALRSRWGFEGFSPNSLMTGDWEQTAARLQAEALRDQWRPLRVVRVEDESQGIRSFYFEAADGAGTSGFKAGQHLPLRVSLDGQAKPVIRTYSLSSAPSDDFFRISVKRDGLVSGHLHDTLKVGDLIEARTPQGGFFVDPLERRPLVLLGAGIGVTPMLSMLREVLYQNKRKRRTRPVWFVQSARRLVDLAFREEVDTLVASAGNELTVVRLLSQPESEARAGQDFHLAGRIDLTLLKTLLPFDDFDFYVCGPASFTQGLYDELRAMHIRDERIHAETFGPSTLKRTRDEQTAGVQQPPAATTSVPVVFERSAKEARWQPDGGTLLELAERRGLEPEYSCRSGSCGTCKTRLIKGQVHYPVAPVDMPAADHVLICCAVPAEGPLVLDL